MMSNGSLYPLQRPPSGLRLLHSRHASEGWHPLDRRNLLRCRGPPFAGVTERRLLQSGLHLPQKGGGRRASAGWGLTGAGELPEAPVNPLPDPPLFQGREGGSGVPSAPLPLVGRSRGWGAAAPEPAGFLRAVARMERQRRAIRVHAFTGQPKPRIPPPLHPGRACSILVMPAKAGIP
jgi:hypothetical protein